MSLSELSFKEYLAQRGTTVSELSKKSGVDPSNLWRWYKGDNERKHRTLNALIGEECPKYDGAK